MDAADVRSKIRDLMAIGRPPRGAAADAVLLLIGGFVGYLSWANRVSSPLAVTRKTLNEHAQWVKERLA